MAQGAVSRWVTYWADIQPKQVAIDFEGSPTTWRDLELLMEKGAAALRQLGVEHGDRVAVLLNNRTEYLTIWFAVARLGAVFVPLNVRSSARELDFVISNSGTKVLIAEAAFAENLAKLSATQEVIVCEVGGSSLGRPWNDLVDRAEPDYELPEPDGSDILALLYTSGTTGRPKGAITTHEQLQYMTVSTQRALDYTRDDRHYAPLPLCFTGGLITVCQPPLASGGTVFLKRTFEPGAAIEHIRQDRCTIWFAPAPLLQLIKINPNFDPEAFQSMRALLAGAAPVPVSTIEFFQDAGVTVAQGYGITEGCGLNTLLASHEAKEKAGSAGRSLMFCPVRVGRADGSPAEPGEQGELLLTGPQVTRGYWREEEATQAAFVDGWFRTGDAAVWDEHGYVTIVDRLKDMIITGAMNVYPAEVEDALLGHEGVASVAVVGQPHEVYGESIVAFVVPKDRESFDLESLRAHAAEALADYKVPHAYEIVDQLPLTTSGKVKKFQLRDELLENPAAV